MERTGQEVSIDRVLFVRLSLRHARVDIFFSLRWIS